MGRKFTTSAVLVMGILALAVCRETGSGGGGGSGTATIGPDGGEVRLGNDATVVISPGVFVEDTVVRITRDNDAPAGHIGPAYDFQPEGVTFEPAVAIRLAYDEEMLDGHDRANLTLAAVMDGVWVPVEGSVVTTEEVTAYVSHFSTYGIYDFVGGGDGDADGDVDGDVDGDADGDIDDSCTPGTCEDVSMGCTCEWNCPWGSAWVWCDFTEWQCDCNGDESFDCTLGDVGMNSDACGTWTCCI